MSKKLNITFDSDLLESISASFDLRAPNKEALRQLIFTLDGEYNPEVMQVLDLATGVGKTYLMAAFIEYLRQQGVGNVMIVTPGKVVQAKTVMNFTLGSSRYISGTDTPPDVVTPNDYTAWITRVNGDERLSYGRETPVLAFIFNIQQLIAPRSEDGETHGSSDDSVRRRPRKFDENAGVLFDYLKGLDDLVVIADESHLYSVSADAFHSALRELEPAACVGLTASASRDDHVIYRYPLYQAIKDQYVKTPVLAFRKGGYGEDEASEEQQLRDALQLRELKQGYYDTYAMQQGREHINALAFIVCSDVNHATQVAELLKGPEFFNSDSAVLQVDSQHDTDGTQYLLERLELPESTIKAVVSVNKLKEGWDVKNIAVIVTLRAMASEVLTQQTMGRGLRLPFGKYTYVWQIDQLDIIAHQSFQELLAAENVLQQFGLEDAVAEDELNDVNNAIAEAAKYAESNNGLNANQTGVSALDEAIVVDFNEDNDSPSHQNTVKRNIVGNSVSGASSLGIRTIASGSPEPHPREEIIEIFPNPRFADVKYSFPLTTVEVKTPEIELSEIDDGALEDAARRVTSTGDVLHRKEIVASLSGKIKLVDAESAEVDSISIDEDEAKLALVKLVTNFSMVPKKSETLQYISTYLVPKFMSYVTFENWTVKSLDSARTQLQQLIKSHIDACLRDIKEVPTIHPKEICIDSFFLRIGEKVYDPIDNAADFVPRRYYSGWFKSLYESESFDSYSGEYLLAKLLNTSPNIKWWHRLHPQNNAYIFYNSKDRYFPDFVAQDEDGVLWIIEGKDLRGRDDDKVRAKRKAAETLVRRLATVKEFEGQTWGYLVAYEDDIAESDSWNDLKTLAQPVTNAI